MGTTSKRWPLAAALIAVGAALEGAAVTLVWRPCAGQMLNGSALQGYRYDSPFTEACATAMDEAPMFVLPQAGDGWLAAGSLGALAGVLLAAAWLVLLPTLQVSRRVKLIAALPGVLSLGLVGTATALAVAPGAIDEGIGRFLLLSGELSAAVALFALALAGVSGSMLLRYGIVAFAATSVGLFHQLTEYVFAIGLSDANWDAPPGAGYLTVATCLLAALATAALWWRDDRPVRAPSGAPATVPPAWQPSPASG